MFELGEVCYTSGIACEMNQGNITESDIKTMLTRHKSGDWGNVPEEDKQTNDDALKEGSRVLSSYTINNVKVWIITEWDRSITTMFLPSEY